MRYDDQFLSVEESTEFEVMYVRKIKKYMLRVADKLIGYVKEPTIEACKAKMLEVLL